MTAKTGPVVIKKATITRLMWCETCETAGRDGAEHHDADDCQACSEPLVEMGWYETACE